MSLISDNEAVSSQLITLTLIFTKLKRTSEYSRYSVYTPYPMYCTKTMSIYFSNIERASSSFSNFSFADTDTKLNVLQGISEFSYRNVQIDVCGSSQSLSNITHDNFQLVCMLVFAVLTFFTMQPTCITIINSHQEAPVDHLSVISSVACRMSSVQRKEIRLLLS